MFYTMAFGCDDYEEIDKELENDKNNEDETI